MTCKGCYYNKSADEMFEELGYKKQEYGTSRIFYSKELDFEGYCLKTVWFDRVKKFINLGGNYNIEDLQAINKKVEELRMEVEKCEYCNLVSGEEKEIKEGCYAGLFLERHNNTYTLIAVSTNRDIECVEIEINYCPICGRKLV